MNTEKSLKIAELLVRTDSYVCINRASCGSKVSASKKK